MKDADPLVRIRLGHVRVADIRLTGSENASPPRAKAPEKARDDCSSDRISEPTIRIKGSALPPRSERDGIREVVAVRKKKELFDVRGTDVEMRYLQQNSKITIETLQ